MINRSKVSLISKTLSKSFSINFSAYSSVTVFSLYNPEKNLATEHLQHNIFFLFLVTNNIIYIFTKDNSES